MNNSDYHELCLICNEPIFWQSCDTGGWWVHSIHPADGHDARAKYSPQEMGDDGYYHTIPKELCVMDNEIIQVKITGQPRDGVSFLVGTDVKVYGRVFNRKNGEATTDWKEIPCSSLTLYLSSPDSIAEAYMSVYPSQIDGLVSSLDNTVKVEMPGLTELNND